jgi:hypothetical protein
MVQVTYSDKPSSLQWYRIIYEHKKFYNIVGGGQTAKAPNDRFKPCPPANIWLRCKWLTVMNIQAYYGTELIMTVKFL